MRRDGVRSNVNREVINKNGFKHVSEVDHLIQFSTVTKSVSKKVLKIGKHVRVGVNFINILRTAFEHVDPKRVKNTAKSQCLFTLF